MTCFCGHKINGRSFKVRVLGTDFSRKNFQGSGRMVVVRLVVGRRVAQKNKNPITMQSSELPINDISEFISICALCLLQALSRCSCLNEYCM